MKTSTLSFLFSFLFMTLGVINAQECRPLFHEVYSFPVGSEFQYKTTEGGENPYHNESVEYYKITQKWTEGDTLCYVREGSYEFSEYMQGFNRRLTNRYSSEIHDTIRVVNSPEHLTNKCNGDLVLIDPVMEYYSILEVTEPEIRVGGENNIFKLDESSLLIQVESSDSHDYKYKMVFHEDAGLQEMIWGDMMAYTKIECEGYIVNGDTTGIFKNKAVYAPVLSNEMSFEIFPNILQADCRVNIVSSEEFKSLQIVSYDGKVISSEELHQDYVILDAIPRGIYFLNFVFDDRRITRKVIKQ